MTEQNKERLSIVIWLIISIIGTIVFFPVGLAIDFGLIAWLLFKMFH